MKITNQEFIIEDAILIEPWTEWKNLVKIDHPQVIYGHIG